MGMTLRTRNNIMTLSLTLCLGLIGYILSLTFGGATRGVSFLFTQDLVFMGIQTAIPLTIALFGILSFFRYFRKVTGSLIFFFFIFLVSLLFEAAPFIGHYWRLGGMPFDWMISLTRARIFGLATGLLALFVASVYTAGITYKHQGTTLLIILGFAYGIAGLVPINTSEIGLGGIMEIGGLNQLIALKAVVMGLTFINFLYSTKIHQNMDDLWIGITTLGLLGGRWLMHGSQSLATLLLGGGLLTLGAIFYGKKVFSLYLWY